MFLEERHKGGAMGASGALGGKPMVHPETGQTGWDGCPNEYYRDIFDVWKRQLGGQGHHWGPCRRGGKETPTVRADRLARAGGITLSEMFVEGAETGRAAASVL